MMKANLNKEKEGVSQERDSVTDLSKALILSS